MQAQVNQTLYKRDEMTQACEHIDHVCVADCKIAHSNMNKTIKDLKDNADPGYNISYDNIDSGVNGGICQLQTKTLIYTA